MILFPNAKINLGLNVTEKRKDGFHNIQSVFVPINYCDCLEIIENINETIKKNKLKFTFSGMQIDGDPTKNIVAKAYELLNNDFNLPAVKIHLHKTIPVGAGLGGGSSDAAFTLKGLNDLFNLKLQEKELISYAIKLGSDCAFFIRNKPVFASGKGEIFDDCFIDLKKHRTIVVWPNIHISTLDAFKNIKPKQNKKNLKEIITNNITGWKNVLKNDFEETIFKKHPQIGVVKEKLYANGALYASMSGSGSAVYGIFENEIPKIDWPDNYLTHNQ